MYTKRVPFKDLNGKPHNGTVNLYLFETSVFKLLPELLWVFSWLESQQSGEVRTLEPEDVKEFYTNFENLIVEAWGEPSADGMHFHRGGKYEYEESVLHNALMVSLLSDPAECGVMIKDMLPEGLEEIVKKSQENVAKLEGGTPDQAAQIAALQAQLAQAQVTPPPAAE